MTLDKVMHRSVCVAMLSIAAFFVYDIAIKIL